mgnify:CR=1 FL=1
MFDYLDLLFFALNFITGYFAYNKGKRNLPEAEIIAKELTDAIVKAASDRKITASELKDIADKAKKLAAKLGESKNGISS